MQGKSLTPVLDDPSTTIHDAVYCLRGKADHLYRTDRWALITYNNGKGGIELYDMQADPQQVKNLAKADNHQATLAELQAGLKKKLLSIRED